MDWCHENVTPPVKNRTFCKVPFPSCSKSIIMVKRFHVAILHLFSYRSQMISNCGTKRKVANKIQLSVSLIFLQHFDVYYCDLLLYRPMVTWSLFFYMEKEQNVVNGDVICVSVSSNRSQVRTLRVGFSLSYNYQYSAVTVR